MWRWNEVLLFLILLFLLMMVAGGCAPGKEAQRHDGSDISVRFPPREAPDVSLHTEGATALPNEAPFSPADEIRGQWLPIVEMTVTPHEPEKKTEEP